MSTITKTSFQAARLATVLVCISFTSLFILHVLSPGYDPSWRMVSEYAYGPHQPLLFIFFFSWGLASWFLCLALWPLLSSTMGRIGVILLFVSGVGESMAAFFDVTHDLHGTSGALGVPPLPIAAVIISILLVRNYPISKRTILWSAHLTWISLLAMIVSLAIMVSGLMKTGNFNPEAKVPLKEIPAGVIAVAGYFNRLLILAYQGWIVLTSLVLLKLWKSSIK